MSEKSDDPQNSEAEEFGKAPSLSDVIDEPSSEADDAQSLAEIDQLLAEEDPEFLQQISEIKVEATEGSLSIMEDVLADVKKSRRPSFNWRFHLQNLLFLKEEPKKIILFWGLVASCVLLVLFGSQISDLYFSKGLFLRSFSSWNSEVHTYNPLSESEPFYDNPRFAKNLMTMTKMVTNVKGSDSSGSNPMLAVELSVEGMSSEAIIELKDREAEFKDILLRQAEEFTYDELSSADGKKIMLQRFTVVINANLSQGQVRRTLLKSFMLKP